MPRGGARRGSGPAPDPGSLRELARLEAGTVRTLPKERNGRAPSWPLATKATADERAMWQSLWKTPQAIIWEEQHVERAVARYVRFAVAIEAGDAPTAKARLVGEMERILLLELGSLLKAGYRITSVESTAAPVVGGASAEARCRSIPSSRGRLQALDSLPDSRTRLRPLAGGDDA